jgi:hypothetical protein
MAAPQSHDVTGMLSLSKCERRLSEAGVLAAQCAGARSLVLAVTRPSFLVASIENLLSVLLLDGSTFRLQLIVA